MINRSLPLAGAEEVGNDGCQEGGGLVDAAAVGVMSVVGEGDEAGVGSHSVFALG